MKETIEATLFSLRMALESEDIDRARHLVNNLHPADLAEAIGDLPLQDQTEMLPTLSLDDAADVLEHLDEDEAAEIAAQLPLQTLASVLDEMEPDEAADILLDLDKTHAAAALRQMTSVDTVRPLLQHEDDTAGGRMTTRMPVLRPRMTASQAITYLRDLKPDPEHHYYLYVVDVHGQLIGVVGLRKLITARASASIESIMDTQVISASVSADQEACAQLMSRYELMTLPIVGDGNRLAGVITYDDLVEVIEDEATEDIYALASLAADSDLDVFSPVRMMVSRRLPWLYLNLGMAFLAAFVISRFEAIIAKIAVLAVFQSVVAGLGGNAGTQALALMVRGLALGQVEFRHMWRALGRELLIGLLHGIAIGAAVAGVVYIWRGNPILGLIIGMATCGNMLVAVLMGTLVPLTLKALHLDPALASSVLVTGTTDAVGFALFLGLATLYLPYLT